MRQLIKPYLITFGVLLLLLGICQLAYGAPTSTIVRNLFIAGIAPSTTSTLVISASGLIQAASGTDISTLLGGVNSQILFGQLGGGATSTSLVTFSTSTGALTVGTSTFTNASGTNISLTGFIQPASLTLNSTNFTSLQGSGLTISSGALTCSTASASVFGCLTSANWTTFNSKISVQSLPSSTSWVDGQFLFGILGGNATSNAALSVVTSTGIVTVGTTTITNATITRASTTRQDTSGYLRLNNQNAVVSNGVVDGQILFGILGTSQSTSTALLTITTSTGIIAHTGASTFVNVSSTGNLDLTGGYAHITATAGQSGDTLRVSSSSGDRMLWVSSGTTAYVQPGQSTTTSGVALGGTLAFSTKTTGNAAAASTTLFTYSLSGSTLSRSGDEIDIFFGGTISGSTSTNKQLQFVVTSTVVFDTTKGTSIIPASVAGTFFGQVRCSFVAVNSSSICATQFTDSMNTALTDDSGDAGNVRVPASSTTPISFTLYGNGTSGGDVTGNYWRVLFMPAP